MNPNNRPVLFFNSLLLPPSQTFIRAQGEMLQQFTAYYAGSRRVPGLELPPDRTLVVNSGTPQGTIAEGVFKLTGIAPTFVKAIQHLQPALVHAQFGLSGALMLPLMQSLQVPLIVHYRGADATVQDKAARYASLNHWIYFRRRSALKQKAHLFLTVSNFIRQKLIDQGFPPEKIKTFYQGVNVEQFRPNPAIPRESIVLFVGRLTEKKGCEYLIRAIAPVQAQLPEVKLVIIGEGPLRPALETLAVQHLQQYEFLGTQPPEVVKAWMNRAKVMATPSVTAAQGDSEGLPNVVLEAQAMGLPVVSTIHAGIPEAVINGETGFLAPEQDIEALTQGCLRLLKTDDLWQHFSTRGRNHVETHFNRQIQTQLLEQIYTAVLQGEI
jgi:colanic acid/amylovoran biosynthesis glycosyltransferase